MTNELRTFLEAQRASAAKKFGSHQARKRALVINFAKGSPEVAAKVAEEINANPEAASEVCGFHPDACRCLAWMLQDWRRAL